MNSISLKREESDKRVGVIVTIVFHALLLLLFLFIGLKQPNPLPKEEAIELSFESAGGPSGGDSSPAAAEAAAQPVEESTPDDAEPIATEEESPVAIPKAEKPKPTPKPDPKPVERKPDSRSLFESSNTGSTSSSSSSSTGSGSSSSTGTGGGSEGGSGAFSGRGFEGHLQGRGVARVPTFGNENEHAGTVAVDIKVDASGNVIYAKSRIGLPTTTTATELHRLAEHYARKFIFTPKAGAQDVQSGYIAIVFTLN